jgi:hypothetical protein
MKKKPILTILIFLVLASSVYSQGISIAISEVQGDEQDTVAYYEDLSTELSWSVTTIIKSNGLIIRDFDFDQYYEEATNKAELDKLQSDIREAKIIFVSYDIEENQLTLMIGSNPQEYEEENFFVSSSFSFTDIDFSTHGLYELEKGISVFCLKE